MAELRRKLEDGIHKSIQNELDGEGQRVVFFFESPLNLNPWTFLEKKHELLLIHRVASLVHFTHTCHCIQIIL